MNEDEQQRNRMPMIQQPRIEQVPPQGQAPEDPNAASRFSSNPPRTTYRLNNNVYSRYRPARPSSYRNKHLSQNDILRALTTQFKPQESLADLKAKQEKLRSKESFAIR